MPGIDEAAAREQFSRENGPLSHIPPVQKGLQMLLPSLHDHHYEGLLDYV